VLSAPGTNALKETEVKNQREQTHSKRLKMASKADESTHKFPLLSASVDYHSWSISAKAMLMKKNLLWTITDPVPGKPTLQSLYEKYSSIGFQNEPAEGAIFRYLVEAEKSYDADLYKACGELIESISTGTRPIIAGLRAPIEIWNRLKADFDKNTPDQLFTPFLSLTRLRLEHPEMASVYGMKHVEAVNRIKSMNLTLFTPDNLVVANLLGNLGPEFAAFKNAALASWGTDGMDVAEINRRLISFTDSLQPTVNTTLLTVRPNLNRGNSNKRQRQGTVSGKKVLTNPCTDTRCQKDNHEAGGCFYKDPTRAPHWWREKVNQPQQSEHIQG